MYQRMYVRYNSDMCTTPSNVPWMQMPDLTRILHGDVCTTVITVNTEVGEALCWFNDATSDQVHQNWLLRLFLQWRHQVSHFENRLSSFHFHFPLKFSHFENHIAAGFIKLFLGSLLEQPFWPLPPLLSAKIISHPLSPTPCTTFPRCLSKMCTVYTIAFVGNPPLSFSEASLVTWSQIHFDHFLARVFQHVYLHFSNVKFTLYMVALIGFAKSKSGKSCTLFMVHGTLYIVHCSSYMIALCRKPAKGFVKASLKSSRIPFGSGLSAHREGKMIISHQMESNGGKKTLFANKSIHSPPTSSSSSWKWSKWGQVWSHILFAMTSSSSSWKGFKYVADKVFPFATKRIQSLCVRNLAAD